MNPADPDALRPEFPFRAVVALPAGDELPLRLVRGLDGYAVARGRDGVARRQLIKTYVAVGPPGLPVAGEPTLLPWLDDVSVHVPTMTDPAGVVRYAPAPPFDQTNN